MTPSIASVRHYEELTLNTSPAIHQAFYDGWVLRASGTDTRRANSVTALAAGTLPLAEKIAYCEAWYRHQAQPSIFRFTDAFMPIELDAMLAARGYTREVDTYVMTVALDDVQTGEIPAGVKRLERSTAEGLADVHGMKGSSPQALEQDLQRQALWKGGEKYLSLKTINGVVATGLARIDGDFVGIFNMHTAKTARRKGYASLLVAELLAWGRGQGARTAFLQVDQTNAAAISAYRKFGFAPVYSYWHRVQGA